MTDILTDRQADKLDRQTCRQTGRYSNGLNIKFSKIARLYSYLYFQILLSDSGVTVWFGLCQQLLIILMSGRSGRSRAMTMAVWI
jgi:hypothetical protein